MTILPFWMRLPYLPAVLQTYSCVHFSVRYLIYRWEMPPPVRLPTVLPPVHSPWVHLARCFLHLLPGLTCRPVPGALQIHSCISCLPFLGITWSHHRYLPGVQADTCLHFQFCWAVRVLPPRSCFSATVPFCHYRAIRATAISFLPPVPTFTCVTTVTDPFWVTPPPPRYLGLGGIRRCYHHRVFHRYISALRWATTEPFTCTVTVACDHLFLHRSCWVPLPAVLPLVLPGTPLMPFSCMPAPWFRLITVGVGGYHCHTTILPFIHVTITDAILFYLPTFCDADYKNTLEPPTWVGDTCVTFYHFTGVTISRCSAFYLGVHFGALGTIHSTISGRCILGGGRLPLRYHLPSGCRYVYHRHLHRFGSLPATCRWSTVTCRAPAPACCLPACLPQVFYLVPHHSA